MKRTAESIWKGSGREGKGHLTTQSGALDHQPYSFKFRFENEDGKKGTNPEELIGAAHAGCYNMALAVALEQQDIIPEELRTRASVNLAKSGNGFAIDEILLELTAKIKGISEEKFQEISQAAKENCPVSKVLAGARISLQARLL